MIERAVITQPCSGRRPLQSRLTGMMTTHEMNFVLIHFPDCFCRQSAADRSCQRQGLNRGANSARAQVRSRRPQADPELRFSRERIDFDGQIGIRVLGHILGPSHEGLIRYV